MDIQRLKGTFQVTRQYARFKIHHQNFQEESDGEEGGNGVQDPVNSEPVLEPVQRCHCSRNQPLHPLVH